jgi:hypothetical protein
MCDVMPANPPANRKKIEPQESAKNAKGRPDEPDLADAVLPQMNTN